MFSTPNTPTPIDVPVNGCVDVAVCLPVFSTYTYRVPADLAAQAVPGKRVTVPFGKRSATGYILGPAGETPDGEIKPILEILDILPLFPDAMTGFFRWIADYYLYPLGETIKNALPAATGAKATSRVTKKNRDAVGEVIAPDTPPELTLQQRQVVTDVAARIGDGFYSCLLAGVTGSGKTEVYMRLAEAALEKDRDALILVPEIALIVQAERRFKARFGDRIAVLHSSLSATERRNQWMRIVRGEVRLAIGTRSAIFAPLPSPGVIIVDEEHDTSYKQENGLRYNARDLALVRGKQSGAVVVLGSATPSMQSVYNAATGKFSAVYSLDTRINNQPLPEITVVDLRRYEDRRGLERFITDELRQAMQETLAAGNQVLLFLNRRGFASFPVCAACGQAVKCKNCDITMTLHRAGNAYRCHFCGFSRPLTAGCAQCGSTSIKQLGLGTEKVEEAVRKLFPEAAVDRLDRDTTVRKGSVARILKDVRKGKTDILIGTQMVAKGHDFPGITLIGIICADMSLNFPDFRAGEVTFQLLAQVAGRAGRGNDPGRVIMQTYNPDHFSIQTARMQDVSAFYEKEIAFRRQLSYPPYARLVQLRISGGDSDKTRAQAQLAGQRCAILKQSDLARFGSVEILGPAEAPIYRLAGRFRWQILLKARSANVLNGFVASLLTESGAAIRQHGVRLVVDVDPYVMM
ncbi:MAG: primosomal protein N' [Thermodesulfobacteriota bacterium]